MGILFSELIQNIYKGSNKVTNLYNLEWSIMLSPVKKPKHAVHIEHTWERW